jgi:hypothetical protein
MRQHFSFREHFRRGNAVVGDDRADLDDVIGAPGVDKATDLIIDVVARPGVRRARAA